MKYFFVAEQNHATHILVAKTEENARNIANNSNMHIKDLYELDENVFSMEGVLITQNSYLITLESYYTSIIFLT